MSGVKIMGLSFIGLLVGCNRPYQRFIPIGDNTSIALDTKTGQQCWTEPKKSDLVPQIKEMKGVFCVDLYRNSR